MQEIHFSEDIFKEPFSNVLFLSLSIQQSTLSTAHVLHLSTGAAKTKIIKRRIYTPVFGQVKYFFAVIVDIIVQFLSSFFYTDCFVVSSAYRTVIRFTCRPVNSHDSSVRTVQLYVEISHRIQPLDIYQPQTHKTREENGNVSSNRGVCVGKCLVKKDTALDSTKELGIE